MNTLKCCLIFQFLVLIIPHFAVFIYPLALLFCEFCPTFYKSLNQSRSKFLFFFLNKNK